MRRRARVLLAAVATAIVLVTGSGAAVAAGPVDDSTYSEAERVTAEQTAATQTAERTCDLFAIGLLASFRGSGGRSRSGRPA